MVQVPPPTNVVLQLFVCVKSPLATILPMLMATLPVLPSVTVREALTVPTFWKVKVICEGVNVSPAVWAVAPVPVRVMEWGLPAALSLTVSDPVRVPAAVGVNVTLMVQLAEAASGETQLLV